MERIKQQYKDYKLYTKIQQDSKDLSMALKRNMKNFSPNGDDMFLKRNCDLVQRHLKSMDQYILTQDVKKLRAKEFPPNHTWFNVAEPLRMDYHLKGKIVLIDFWTYCCINCLHILPDLEYLEEKYMDYSGIVFMGCHSAKFTNEKGAQKVRDAILKYDVKHPVINDDKMLVWRNFERRSWPGLIILGPRGVPILILSGEGHKQTLDLFLTLAYQYYEPKLNKNMTIPVQLEEQKESPKENTIQQKEYWNARSQNLKFPGKVICIEKQEGIDFPMIIISDTGNNRILLINAETNTCTDVIGNPHGEIGLIDGTFEEASFHHPQGICHVYREKQHFLYLCDTKNHAIREISLAKREVLTVIGTGVKGNDKEGNKNPEDQKLSSPWDIVAINRDTLIFAMAGTHQIWALNLKTNRGFNFSGSGREGNYNNKHDLKSCEWAQPSGLSLGIISNNKIELYVADSESSAIRSINMKTLQASRLLVGGDKNPKNLHAYGDLDGQSEVAKLQHPLGVSFIPEKNVIAVTDTYNHKIKVIDPFNNEIFSWLGNGHATLKDDQTFDASLNEPSGICSMYDPQADDIKVFIADCNNHCIRYVHYDQGNLMTPEFKGVPSCDQIFTQEIEEEERKLNSQQHNSLLDENNNSKGGDRTGSSVGNTTIETMDTTGIICQDGKCIPKWLVKKKNANQGDSD